jgi:thiosulfate/3-mercaptopyruvate sulfurtransferase
MRETSLVTADWVTEHLTEPDVRVVEVDEDVDAFHRGHIPGATALDWTRDLQDGVRRDVVSPEGFAALMDARGIGSDTTVVLYGGNNNWFAAYAYWYFKLYGHHDVRLLDGGRKLWELEGRPMTIDVQNGRRGHGYPVPTANLLIRAFREQVLREVMAANGTSLVDVRSPEEFRGEKLAPDHLPGEQAQRPGHIPGAVNIPWAKAVDPDTGRFLDNEWLLALYGGAGITPDRDVVAYCRIGERSAHTWFVLHELLGYSKVRNYDGSWTEYGSLVGVPVER